MPRHLAISILLPGILGVLLFMATLSERSGATGAAIAQNDEQVTLLAVETAGSHPQLYAIDPETAAIGLLVDNLPLAPVALKALDPNRVLIAVNPRSLADPSRVLLADLESHAWHTLFTDLEGAFGLAIRLDRSAVLTAQGRADWPMPITEYNFQTGETRTLASIPSPYQPLDLALTPAGRLFLSAGHNWACVLMELDPVTGAILNQWPGPCEPTSRGGSMYSVAYDPRTSELVGAVYVRTLDEARIWRFQPDTDTALRVWMTLPGAQGRFDRIAVAPDGTLYAAAYTGQRFPGRDWGAPRPGGRGVRDFRRAAATPHRNAAAQPDPDFDVHTNLYADGNPDPDFNPHIDAYPHAHGNAHGDGYHHLHYNARPDCDADDSGVPAAPGLSTRRGAEPVHAVNQAPNGIKTGCSKTRCKGLSGRSCKRWPDSHFRLSIADLHRSLSASWP